MSTTSPILVVFVLLAVCCLPVSVFGPLVAVFSPSVAHAADTPQSDVGQSETNVPLAGHSEHGEAYNEGPRQNAYLMGGTGKVKFPVTTTSDEAKQYFAQGVGQLYGFWYYEAERSFRRVAAIDPDCAMAYWGMARANDENKLRAKTFIADAVKRKGAATERERMYIEALEKYLTDESEEKKVRDAYTKALEKVIRKFPEDIEAKAMLAVHLWQSSQHGVPMNSHQAVDSLLGDVFRVEPMHSAHHFRIHLWDGEEPSQALESAAKCGQSAPTIAHMWHMPGHIYSRLNRFGDAVFQQEASARADHAHMMRDGVLPDQIHNYAHNNEWLIRNLVHLGRAERAMSLAKNMLELPRHPKYNSFAKDGMCSCKYGRLRLLQILESFEMWDDVIALANTMYLEPTDDKEEQGKRHRFLGIAHYYRGESEKLQQRIVELEPLLAQFDADATKAGEAAVEKKRKEFSDADQAAAEKLANENKADDKVAEDIVGDESDVGNKNAGEDAGCPSEVTDNKSDQQAAEVATERCKKIEDARKDAETRARRGKQSVERAIAELKALQFLARGKTDDAIEQFKDNDISKQRLAQYYFLAGDHTKSQELLEKLVEDDKQQVWPLAVQVDVLRRMGKRDEAAKAFEKLRSVAGVAELDTPILVRLKKFAEELAYPADWRQPPELASDIGDRPELDSLGPFRWGPSPAPSWELPDAHAGTISLADYNRRPVVVIFYLGAGCLHCVEQLHKFAPLRSEFNKAGIALVAISTETTTQLDNALDNFASSDPLPKPSLPESASNSEIGALTRFPIPLVANPSMDVFKKYRAYDDFENTPLHGTFLIDGKGLIRWHDISYEPFLDPEFLLTESKRLLSLDVDSSEPTTKPHVPSVVAGQ